MYNPITVKENTSARPMEHAMIPEKVREAYKEYISLAGFNDTMKRHVDKVIYSESIILRFHLNRVQEKIFRDLVLGRIHL